MSTGKVLEAHEERVVLEQSELNEKLQKLGVFIRGEIFKTLSEHEQGRLNLQYHFMTGYNEVLIQRIRHFS